MATLDGGATEERAEEHRAEGDCAEEQPTQESAPEESPAEERAEECTQERTAADAVPGVAEPSSGVAVPYCTGQRLAPLCPWLLRHCHGASCEPLMAHDPAERTVEFCQFATIGAPSYCANRPTSAEKVLYYELEILQDLAAPLSFACAGFDSTRVGADAGAPRLVGGGVGDDDESWGVDGVRSLAWHGGGYGRRWGCQWAVGDVISLAANVDVGKIAVAKNGAWFSEAGGVIFMHERIKESEGAVFPCLTAAAGRRLRYNLDGASHGPFRFGPPPSGVWEGVPLLVET